MSKIIFTAATGLATLVASPSFAHVDPLAHGSLASGLTHPLFGLDHIITMVAVGLWAAMLGRSAMIALPVAFVAAMIAGFGLSLINIGLPAVEPMILASVIVLGVLVALAAKVNVAVALAIVALFGLFHGQAHGAELGGARATQFLLGFAIATAMLHGAGITISTVFARSPFAARVIGSGAAMAGVVLAFG
jgi:urease accessory protein